MIKNRLVQEILLFITLFALSIIAESFNYMTVFMIFTAGWLLLLLWWIFKIMKNLFQAAKTFFARSDDEEEYFIGTDNHENFLRNSESESINNPEIEFENEIKIEKTPAPEPVKKAKKPRHKKRDAKIRSFIKKFYVAFQKYWHVKNIAPLKQYMTEEFFTHADEELNILREAGQTEYTTDIVLIDLQLDELRRKEIESEEFEFITSYMKVRANSYIFDDKTKELVSGYISFKQMIEYEIELSRKSYNPTTCPYCCAPLNSGAEKCEYCGGSIADLKPKWLVSNFATISQQVL